MLEGKPLFQGQDLGLNVVGVWGGSGVVASRGGTFPMTSNQCPPIRLGSRDPQQPTESTDVQPRILDIRIPVFAVVCDLR